MTTNLPLFFTLSTINFPISKSKTNFISFFPSSAPHRPNLSSSSFSFRRFKYVPNFASGDGNGGVRSESGGGGGGDGGSDGGDAESKLLAGDVDVDGDSSTLSTDAIILDVRGMTCKGCSASVKRILETQQQVSHASVDLASETAVVWAVAEAKITPNWREELGEALAKHLTTCGFSSNVQGA